MLDTKTMDSAVVEVNDAPPKRRRRLWLVALGLAAIAGAGYVRVGSGPRDPSNYNMIVPTLIPGFHAGHRSMMSSFAFESDNHDALIKGGEFRLVSSIRPDGDLESDDMASVLKQSTNLPGWKPGNKEPDINVDGLSFKVLRRDAPGVTMLSAVAARGNDTYEVTLVVSGPRNKQLAALESYRPAFTNFLTSITFARLPMVPD